MRASYWITPSSTGRLITTAITIGAVARLERERKPGLSAGEIDPAFSLRSNAGYAS
jgi:hypothetical protein